MQPRRLSFVYTERTIHALMCFKNQNDHNRNSSRIASYLCCFNHMRVFRCPWTDQPCGARDSAIYPSFLWSEISCIVINYSEWCSLMHHTHPHPHPHPYTHVLTIAQLHKVDDKCCLRWAEMTEEEWIADSACLAREKVNGNYLIYYYHEILQLRYQQH